MRPKVKEMIAIEMIVCYLQFPRGDSMPRHGGPDRGTPGSVRSQKEQGESTGKSLYCGFVRKARQGEIREVYLGLASLSHYGSRL